MFFCSCINVITLLFKGINAAIKLFDLNLIYTFYITETVVAVIQIHSCKFV